MPLKVALKDIRPPGSDWISAGTVFECRSSAVEDLTRHGLIADAEEESPESPAKDGKPRETKEAEPASLVSLILDLDRSDKTLWMKDGRPRVDALPEGTTGKERDEAWESAKDQVAG